MYNFANTFNPKPEFSKTVKNHQINPSLPMAYIQQALSYALAASLNSYYQILKKEEMRNHKHENKAGRPTSGLRGLSGGIVSQSYHIIKPKKQSIETKVSKYQKVPLEMSLTAPDEKDAYEGQYSTSRLQLEKRQFQSPRPKQLSKKHTRAQETSLNSQFKGSQCQFWGLGSSQISLKSEANIPQFSIKHQELSLRKQALLQRKVDDWPYRPKKEKIRREIRGLMN